MLSDCVACCFYRFRELDDVRLAKQASIDKQTDRSV